MEHNYDTVLPTNRSMTDRREVKPVRISKHDLPRMSKETNDDEILKEMREVLDIGKGRQNDVVLGALAAALWVNGSWTHGLNQKRLRLLDFKRYMSVKLDLDPGQDDKLLRCMEVHFVITNRFPDDVEIPKLLLQSGALKPYRVLRYFVNKTRNDVVALLRICATTPLNDLMNEVEVFVGVSKPKGASYEKVKKAAAEPVVLESIENRRHLMVANEMFVPRMEREKIEIEWAYFWAFDLLMEEEDKTVDEVFFDMVRARLEKLPKEKLEKIKRSWEHWAKGAFPKGETVEFAFDDLLK